MSNYERMLRRLARLEAECDVELIGPGSTPREQADRLLKTDDSLSLEDQRFLESIVDGTIDADVDF
jgi:hypothetical protein